MHRSRCTFLLLSALVLSCLMISTGCKNKTWPLIGRTTIPPPPTHGLAPPNPFYAPSGGPTVTPGTPIGQPPAGAVQPGSSSSSTSPPAGFNSTGRVSANGNTSLTARDDVYQDRSKPQYWRYAIPVDTGGQLVPVKLDREMSLARRNEAKRSAAKGTRAGKELKKKASRDNKETENLADAESDTGEVSEENAVQPVSYATEDVPLTKPASGKNISNKSTAKKKAADNKFNYAYDPEYRWLKGKLDYSESENRWTLRYIPLDGETDDYGGSVVLENTPKLKKFFSGAFVAVAGTIQEGEKQDGTFAPSYKINQIAPLP